MQPAAPSKRKQPIRYLFCCCCCCCCLNSSTLAALLPT